MNKRKIRIKDKPFKVIYEYVNTPDAGERFFNALDILINKEDFSLNNIKYMIKAIKK